MTNCLKCGAESVLSPCAVCAAREAAASGDFQFPMPETFPCDVCKVGQVLFRPGTCVECLEAATRNQARADRVAKAVETIPATFRWARFEAPELAQRVKDVKALRIASALPSWTMLVLRGPSASGKTSLGCALFRRAVERLGKDGLFVDAYELANARIDSKLGVQPAIEAKAISAGVLLVDELGNERETANSSLVEVIYKRHASGRPTVITTWMGPSEAVKRYGEGIGRRLFERGRAVRIDLELPTMAAAS